ncbi:hypothetical protein OLX02_01505 [Novosphingobium sp. KCTC 2891]|uniref:calcium-binding protein n=1 Tax=Novosphingobium sp. KCTC 2891 TaxID=2989730 RepID=UPI002223DC6F|nr:calcium-binding protein [Novosphingobium sp. KCTC 2891]MCW1381490.1 hypothetical protein [Novosphingobium sp. KCTC 2891]
MGAAQNTIDNQDDLALLAKAFSGNDRFLLSEQVDAVSGYAGNDVIYGYGGGDLIYGGDGNDRIYGGAGDDQLEGGRGDDLLYGNAGVDTVSYQNADTGVTVDLRITIAQDTIGAGTDTLSSFDRLYGSAFDDRLTGNTGANEIIGLSGNDIILGKAGNDRLDGGSGRDTLTGGTGADLFSLFGFASSADRDLITDFSHAQGDQILLSKLTFQGLSGDVDTALSAAQFYTAAGATKAHDADDRIVYNPVTGAVYYDADGAGGAASVQILKMGAGVHPVLEAGDFLLSF